jgi:biopolymer transport protein ExbB/TolQ
MLSEVVPFDPSAETVPLPKKPLNKNLLGLLISIAVALSAPFLGLGVTVLSLLFSFRQTAAIAPADKARVLAEGISTSMYATASGIVISAVALVPIVVFGVRLYRDSKHEG